MSDDNVIRFPGQPRQALHDAMTSVSPLDHRVDEAVDRLVDMGLVCFQGDGSDNIFITHLGSQVLPVLLCVAEPMLRRFAVGTTSRWMEFEGVLLSAADAAEARA
jgi:hypothetical protein